MRSSNLKSTHVSLEMSSLKVISEQLGFDKAMVWSEFIYHIKRNNYNTAQVHQKVCILSSAVSVNQDLSTTPAAYRTTIHVYKIRASITANASCTTAGGCSRHLINRTTLHAQISSLSLKM